MKKKILILATILFSVAFNVNAQKTNADTTKNTETATCCSKHAADKKCSAKEMKDCKHAGKDACCKKGDKASCESKKSCSKNDKTRACCHASEAAKGAM